MGMRRQGRQRGRPISRARPRSRRGKVTGNESLESEGKADQAEAKVKKAGEHVKDAAKDVKDTFKS